VKGPPSVDEKFESINNSGLDAIKKKKEVKESLPLFHKNETKDKENNDGEMASEIGDTGKTKSRSGVAPSKFNGHTLSMEGLPHTFTTDRK
jgi:hypothetical protein